MEPRKSRAEAQISCARRESKNKLDRHLASQVNRFLQVCDNRHRRRVFGRKTVGDDVQAVGQMFQRLRALWRHM